MNTLRPISESIRRLGRWAWSLPRSFSMTIKEWRQRPVIEALEAERLDRIRNPSKYLGKS